MGSEQDLVRLHMACRLLQEVLLGVLGQRVVQGDSPTGAVRLYQVHLLAALLVRRVNRLNFGHFQRALLADVLQGLKEAVVPVADVEVLLAPVLSQPEGLVSKVSRGVQPLLIFEVEEVGGFEVGLKHARVDVACARGSEDLLRCNCV